MYATLNKATISTRTPQSQHKTPWITFRGHSRSRILESLKSWWRTAYYCIIMWLSTKVRIGRSRSSIIIDFGTNRKRVCNFLLVCHSNLGPILHRFREGFCSWPHPYSILILGVFPLDHIAGVGDTVSRYLRLFGREVIFEVFQPMWSRYLNVTDRQTDGGTDDILWHNRALRSIAR